MAPTRPVSCAYRASSARLHCARGPSCVAGNSQARALTCTMTSPGENPRPARAVAVVQPREPSLEEALAPLGDHFSATVQLLGDLVVPPSVGGQEDHLGSQDFKVRQRILSCTPLQISRFLITQLNVIRTLPRHASRPPRAYDSFTIRCLIYGSEYLAQYDERVINLNPQFASIGFSRGRGRRYVRPVHADLNLDPLLSPKRRGGNENAAAAPPCRIRHE